MKPEAKNKTWLTLLLRWLSGDATRKDEQALEALTENDPFLAEALEGYRSLSMEDHAAAVTWLKASLRKRSQKRRAAGFYLIRVAAVGVVLVAAWVFFQQLNNAEKSAAEMAHSVQEPPEIGPSPFSGSASTAADSVSLDYGFKDEQADALSLKSVREQSGPAESKPAAAEGELQAARPAETLQAMSEQEKLKSTDTSASFMMDEIAAAPPPVEETESSKPKTSVPARKMEPAKTGDTGLRTVTGIVTDEYGEPLIGVSILAANTHQVAVTDVDGSFKIDVGNDVPALSLSYTGYETEQVPLQGQSFLQVQMKPGAQLEEVTVTRPGTAKKQKVSHPEPKGGFKDFEKYLEKNLRYPQAAAQNGVEGKVTLRFQVGQDGKLKNIEVLESLGFGCDEEAIRLLKEGPKWKPEGKATYTVKFKL